CCSENLRKTALQGGFFVYRARDYDATERISRRSFTVMEIYPIRAHRIHIVITLDLREFQQQQEKDFLQTSLQQAKFNQKKAAELLGLTYHQLRALLKKHQI
ncbi:TPA: helix-turn-helix domain-containing protein, partial [Escherichia coli]|nr:helix-turn-helix domain-containing protein [Escherichia coli]